MEQKTKGRSCRTMNTEVIVIQYLNKHLNVPVSGEVPKSLPDKFITVERVSGGREAMVLDLAEIMISIYNKNSKLEAANLADEIADIMPNIVAEYEDVTRGHINSVIQDDDTTRQYRRYRVFADVYNRR